MSGTASGTASETFGARERPYDQRWGTPEQVKDQFGVNVSTLKAAWLKGWIRARQGNWESDDKRTQTIYCFEDIHRWLEEVAHHPSKTYVKKFWTAAEVAAAAVKKGPYKS